MTFSEGTNLPATIEGPPRLDDRQIATLRPVADAPLPALIPCEPDHLNKCIAVLDAALPRRNADDVSGSLMAAAYRRKLGHMPREQIDFLSNAILDRCRWFPTIAECIEIAAEWERQDARDKARARNLIEREMQARFEDAMHKLRWGDITQEEVDGWPQRWKEIAATRGDLFRDPDRLFKIRPRLLDAPTTEEPECPNEPPSTEE